MMGPMVKSNTNKGHEMSINEAINNSELQLCAWADGMGGNLPIRWDIYIPYADHVTDSGRAATIEDAREAATLAAWG